MNDADTLPDAGVGEVGIVRYQDFECKEALVLQSGASLPSFTIRYETYGRLNKEHSNAILVCHALTGDHHAAGVYGLRDRKPGWWNIMIGPGKPIDTNKYFVVVSNCLGGCQGSTGPSSTNPATGKPYGLDFPLLSISDMVAAQKRLVDFLEIPKLHCLVGGSMGGMQVLQWMIDYPGFVKKALPMATTARQSAQAIAFNEVGRSAIMQDPEWENGDYPIGKGPHVGLAIARMMAHITYLSEESMENRFGRMKKTLAKAAAEKQNVGRAQFDVEFEVESYLRYQGKSFVDRFDANTYLYFTKALDRFDLHQPSGKLDDAFKDVQAETLVIGFSSDWLFPPEKNREIVYALLRNCKYVSYAQVAMSRGHDSFLVDAPELFELVQNFL